MLPYNMTRQEMLLAVSGGFLVSLAACLYYLVFGKLLQNASLIEQLLKFKYSQEFSIQMTVLSGIIFCSAFLRQLYHEHFVSFWPFDTRSFESQTDVGTLMISGLLVGFGATLAGGCTFGHGIVGIPRLNIRSILSVIFFSATAFYTNKWQIVKKIPSETNTSLTFNLPENMHTDYYIEALFLVPFIFYVLSKDKSMVGLAKFIIAFLIGIIAGMGMMVGGLTKRQLVLKMFSYDRNWDPTILVFYTTCILINLVIFTFVIKNKITPVFATEAMNPKGNPSLGLLIGSISFGIGWGLSGLCPGPFLLLIPLKSLKISFYWGLSLCGGIKIAELFSNIISRISESQKANPPSQ